MFPDADRFESRDIDLDAAQLQALAAQGVQPRSAHWAVRIAQRGGTPLGFVVVDEVIGKFELITYAVGIAHDGAVKQVEVLSYRESHGHEIRLPAWRKQFVGKTAASPLKLGEDIANIIVKTGKEGVPVYVRDVGEVVTGATLRQGATVADGKGEIVTGIAIMLKGENSRAVARAVQGTRGDPKHGG